MINGYLIFFANWIYKLECYWFRYVNLFLEKENAINIVAASNRAKASDRGTADALLQTREPFHIQSQRGL